MGEGKGKEVREGEVTDEERNGVGGEEEEGSDELPSGDPPDETEGEVTEDVRRRAEAEAVRTVEVTEDEETGKEAEEEEEVAGAEVKEEAEGEEEGRDALPIAAVEGGEDKAGDVGVADEEAADTPPPAVFIALCASKKLQIREEAGHWPTAAEQLGPLT